MATATSDGTGGSPARARVRLAGGSAARARMFRGGAVTALLAAGAAVAAIALAGEGPRGAVPAGWPRAGIRSGAAALSYPPGWSRVPGDPGTVSAALRDAHGVYVGYLNVTPRQGAERLAGWAAFRAAHNAAEGDREVHVLAGSPRVSFAHARASCVSDEYVPPAGSHRYRELACIVAGRHSTDVFVAAALARDWNALAPVLSRSAQSLAVS